MRVINCKDCGVEVICRSSRTIRCPQCQQKAAAQRSRDYSLEYAREKRRRGNENPLIYDYSWLYSIAQINRDARSRGLSYGKYQALRRNGVI